MFVVFDSVLNAAQVRQLRGALLPERFSSGAATADGDALRVKNNLQFTSTHPKWAPCSDLVIGAVNACRPLIQHALPVRMHYGKHTDAALMSAGGLPLRTDYSMTIFLSSPDEYEGGELVFTSVESVPMAAKLEAGSAVVYPSNTLHEVRPVTRGQRFAAILWMQSALPSEIQRNVVQELDRVRSLLDDNNVVDAKERLKLARENLVRLLAQP